MTTAFIAYEDRTPVVRLWLDRPAQRNAQSQQMLEELDMALRRAIDDPAVNCIVIAGRGAHFSAGHDLKEAQAKRSDFTVEDRWTYESQFYLDYCMRIWDCPKPTIAQVQGACVAGGFMVANMCDLIIASDDAFFADPVCQTLAAAAIEVLIHPWVMGLRKAKEFLFLGERMTAAEALAIGMVNRVVAGDQLDSATLAMAERIAQAPPFGMKLVKRSLNRTLDIQGMRNAVNSHFDTHQLSHVSSEFAAMRERGLATAIQRGREQG
jgi:enoyl-CoA hydratase